MYEGKTLAECFQFGAFLFSETRWWMGIFLLACMIGVGFPDSGGGFVTGAAFLIFWWKLD